VSVQPRGQSNVLDVRATADDARLAARLANLFAQTTLAVRNRRLAELAAAALVQSQADLRALPDQAGDEAQALRTRIAALQRVQTNGDPTLDLLQRAAVPRSPAGLPPVAIVVLTTLAGVLLAVGAAALLELLGPGRINEERDIQALYPLPVLTRLPTLPRRRRTADAPELNEAFRTLQVQLELEPGRHRTVMVTSASTGDGKTTSALGFALELAAGGREVILVDLDLRKPDLADRLRVRPERGIEHLVAGRVPLADALVGVPGTTGLELLAPAGQTDLSTLEAVAGQLPDIIDGATALADYVVLDTPPVGEVSDALKFARSVDDVLVVCRVGRTPKPSFEAMRDVLERVGTRPSGLIVIGGAGAASARYPLATGESLRP
ncbi:MAG TPA: CpsD/CapB family tyrosine-protein kinase, partial [Solirubrobacteraceae bacterium]